MIETNFNSIKNYFYLYSCLPICYTAEISLYGMGISHGFKKSITGENYVEVTIINKKPDIEKDKIMLSMSYQALSSFFNQFTLQVTGIDLNEVCPLRGFLYNELRNEIKNVIKKLENELESV
ncbi:MAG: hypothetical protein M3R36_17770 [Bacteroidota bacterium]|nr:hypothetical protein [Bacteroidota bacterium]